MCSIENCRLENVAEQNRCILHCEKSGWSSIDKNKNKNWDDSIEDVKFFWNKFYEEYMGRLLKNPIDGIIFPRFECNKGLIHIDERANLFSHIDETYLKFSNCIFEDKIDFSNLNKEFCFEKCEFKSTIIINNKKKSDLKFINCPYIKEISIKNAKIKDNFMLDSCCIDSLNFENVDFEHTFFFVNTNIKNNIRFDFVEFNEEAFFNESTIECNLDLTKSIFYKEKNFYKLNTKVENRETARIIKDSFEKQNNIISANNYYVLEMKEREKELSPFINLFEWLTFKIHGITSEHSQDWLLALFWILNISFFFSYFNQQLDNNLNLLLFLERFYINILILGLVGFGIYKISKNIRGWFIFTFTTLNYLFYGFILTNDYSLYCISNSINPFSLMTGEDDLTFGLLIYKITIAYLIYQLIISIRQNTRRK